MGNRGYALQRACPQEKAVHEACESAHFDAFRRGDARIEDNPCRDQWEDYRQCVQQVWDAKTKAYLERKNHPQDNADVPSSSADSTSATDDQQWK